VSFPNKNYGGGKGSILTKELGEKTSVIALILLGGVVAFGGWVSMPAWPSSKAYKSTIRGMSDARYAQCVSLGSEVMELQGSGGQSYFNKQDEWTRYCGISALKGMGVTLSSNPIPLNPKAWARLK